MFGTKIDTINFKVTIFTEFGFKIYHLMITTLKNIALKQKIAILVTFACKTETLGIIRRRSNG